MDAMVLQVRRSLAFLVKQYHRIRWAARSAGVPVPCASSLYCFCLVFQRQNVPLLLFGWFSAWGWL